jgi:hypothetical protein
LNNIFLPSSDTVVHEEEYRDRRIEIVEVPNAYYSTEGVHRYRARAIDEKENPNSLWSTTLYGRLFTSIKRAVNYARKKIDADSPPGREAIHEMVEYDS